MQALAYHRLVSRGSTHFRNYARPWNGPHSLLRPAVMAILSRHDVALRFNATHARSHKTEASRMLQGQRGRDEDAQHGRGVVGISKGIGNLGEKEDTDAPEESLKKVGSVTMPGANIPSTVKATEEKPYGDVPLAKSSGKKKSLWLKIKEEVRHYVDGTKLLIAETRISFRLLFRLTRGAALTRRENRQLRRTASDLFRLVPFSVFILVPFMEFLLPVVLRLFPNMLPSTFESKKQQEEKRKRLLKVRLEMASFLRDTLKEMSMPKKKKDSDKFKEYFNRLRKGGEDGDKRTNTKQVIQIAQAFDDEMTLDHLSRPQLVSMCRYMGITPFGTDHFLRFQISNQMKRVLADDKMIHSESVDSLTLTELQKACQDRGIRVLGYSPARLRAELQQWIKLHLEYRIPSSILILARAFLLLQEDRSPDLDRGISEATIAALQTTLQSLPENLIQEAGLDHAEAKEKLEVIRREEAQIDSEKKDEERRKEEEEELAEGAADEVNEGRTVMPETVMEEAEQQTSRSAGEGVWRAAGSSAVHPTPTPLISEESLSSPLDFSEKPDEKGEPSNEITGEQFQELSEVIKVLSSRSAAEGKEQQDDYVAVDEGAALESGPPKAPVEHRGVETEVTKTEQTKSTKDESPTQEEAWGERPPSPSVGRREHVFASRTREIGSEDSLGTLGESKEEVADEDAVSKQLVNRLKKVCDRIMSDFDVHDPELGTRLRAIQVKEGGAITVTDLESVLRVIGVKSEQLIRETIGRLDKDRDGLIDLDEVAVVCEHALQKEQDQGEKRKAEKDKEKGEEKDQQRPVVEDE